MSSGSDGWSWSELHLIGCFFGFASACEWDAEAIPSPLAGN